MTVLVQQNILGLDVSVYDFLWMQVRKAKEDFDYVKSGHVLFYSSMLFNQPEKLSTWTIFHHKDQILFALESEFHLNDKWMVSTFHDVSFVHDNSLFLVFYDNFLIDDFHSIEAAIFLKSAKKNLRKSSWSNQLDDLKWLKANLLFLVNAVVYSSTRLQIQWLAI